MFAGYIGNVRVHLKDTSELSEEQQEFRKVVFEEITERWGAPTDMLQQVFVTPAGEQMMADKAFVTFLLEFAGITLQLVDGEFI